MKSEILNDDGVCCQGEGLALTQTGVPAFPGKLTLAAGGWSAWTSTLVRGWLVLSGWVEKSRQRRALMALDDRMLKDIGISRADVAQEVGKKFWQ